MVERVRIYKEIDGTVREGGPVNRSSYDAVWKGKGWRLTPPTKKKKEND